MIESVIDHYHLSTRFTQLLSSPPLSEISVITVLLPDRFILLLRCRQIERSRRGEYPKTTKQKMNSWDIVGASVLIEFVPYIVPPSDSHPIERARRAAMETGEVNFYNKLLGEGQGATADVFFSLQHAIRRGVFVPLLTW